MKSNQTTNTENRKKKKNRADPTTTQLRKWAIILHASDGNSNGGHVSTPLVTSRSDMGQPCHHCFASSPLALKANWIHTHTHTKTKKQKKNVSSPPAVTGFVAATGLWLTLKPAPCCTWITIKPREWIADTRYHVMNNLAWYRLPCTINE